MLPPTRTFRDRRHAGAAIGRALFPYVSHPEVIVLGLPRGGVPVAFEIAARLDVALDVLVVRKLGVPGHARVAMGAIASGGIRVFDAEIVEAAGVSSRAFEEVIDRETVELERLEQVWRGARPPAEVHGRTVILVDDGVATGATMLAAISALRTRKPAKIVVAIPVGAPTVCRALRAHVDELLVTGDSIAGELADVVAGTRAGRERDDERILFWHRGLATTDIALGQAILDRAVEQDVGTLLPYR